MKELPDFQTHLPSQVREIIKGFVMMKLKTARLNSYGEPRYSRVDLWQDLDKNNERTPWLIEVANSCFDEMLRVFYHESPCGWDSMLGGGAFRVIDGKKKYYG